jgi:hypothetical protein
MAIFRGIGGAGDSTTDATLTAVTQQATNAASSASAAASSASAASGSAANASTYASNSLTYSQNSQTSSVASSSAKDAAQAAQAAAEAAYDAFDDRYLGAKGSDPATDNDGNALATGALYYDTANSQLKVYTGSAWAAAAVDAAGFLQVLNNLSDLGSAATARTNLGLVIGTDVQAYSSVLAATTASFTTADETKLDGIETAATADQTAQEIATAIDADATAETTLKSALGLGTAAYTASTAYATAAQGTLADSSVQPGDNISTLTNDSGYLTAETYTGTVTSVAASVPTGLSIAGSPITSSGTLAITFTAGYSIPTTSSQTNWDTAYGWGNHASAGYLTSSSTIDGGTY